MKQLPELWEECVDRNSGVRVVVINQNPKNSKLSTDYIRVRSMDKDLVKNAKSPFELEYDISYQDLEPL